MRQDTADLSKGLRFPSAGALFGHKPCAGGRVYGRAH